MSRFVSAFKADTLIDGRMRRVDLEGEAIVVIRAGDTFYALQDRCTHEEFPLSDGWVDNGCVFCPLHGASYDLESGAALTPPAYENVRTFPVRVQDNMVEIEIG